MLPERLVIANGTVVTLNDADDVHFGGSVVIEGDRISQVADGSVPSDGARVIDASDMIVMPGLVDFHCHTALAKGWNDGMPLRDYLERFWYPMVRALDPETAYWAALATYSESIRCGVTAVNDMYRHLDSLADAAERIGIRAVLSNVVAADEHGLDTLADSEAAHRRNNGAAAGRVAVAIGIEWLPLSTEALLRGARGLADTLGARIHMHLSESKAAVEMSIDLFGRRPAEVAYDCGLLGPDCVAAHCIWLSERERDLLVETRTNVSHQPTSNAWGGAGIAPVVELVGAGLNVGLGHDSAEGNNSCDMFEVMKFAALLQRIAHLDPTVGKARDIVRMACRNGNRGLGIDAGELSPGKKADLILVDTRSQMFTPLMPGSADHVFAHLVLAANGSCVDTVIVDGRVIYENREFTTIDEQEVLREANRCFRETVARLERSAPGAVRA